jgi:hypothetical protein
LGGGEAPPREFRALFISGEREEERAKRERLSKKEGKERSTSSPSFPMPSVCFDLIVRLFLSFILYFFLSGSPLSTSDTRAIEEIPFSCPSASSGEPEGK